MMKKGTVKFFSGLYSILLTIALVLTFIFGPQYYLNQGANYAADRHEEEIKKIESEKEIAQTKFQTSDSLKREAELLKEKAISKANKYRGLLNDKKTLLDFTRDSLRQIGIALNESEKIRVIAEQKLDECSRVFSELDEELITYQTNQCNLEDNLDETQNKYNQVFFSLKDVKKQLTLNQTQAEQSVQNAFENQVLRWIIVIVIIFFVAISHRLRLAKKEVIKLKRTLAQELLSPKQPDEQATTSQENYSMPLDPSIFIGEEHVN